MYSKQNKKHCASLKYYKSLLIKSNTINVMDWGRVIVYNLNTIIWMFVCVCERARDIYLIIRNMLVVT